MDNDSSDEDLYRRYEEAIHQFCDPLSVRRPPAAFSLAGDMNNHQDDPLVQTLLRNSEQVLRFGQRESAFQADSDPSAWVHSFIPQVHTGGRRGLGGRPSGSTVDVRRHFKSLLASVLSSSLLSLDENNHIRLTEFFGPSVIDRLKFIKSQGLTNLYKNNFSLLPGNLLGVWVKFTYRDTPISHQNGVDFGIASSRDRHLLCTWIDRQGNVRCSCIGKTLFTAKSKVYQFSSPCCAHASDMYAFFESLIPVQRTDPISESRKVLSSLSAALSTALPAPLQFKGHRGASFLLPYRDYGEYGCCGELWIPIRVSTKRAGALTCAFCDMRSENNCEHIKEWKRCQDIGFHEDGHGGSPSSNSYDMRDLDDDNDMTCHMNDEYLEEKLGRSFLPIAPVNCPSSVQVDRYLGEYVRSVEVSASTARVFLVRAPLMCSKCGAERDELSRKEMGEGILSCTLGPVRMQVESFRCSDSDCQAIIYEEGRNHKLVFYSFSSAATHAFMRREIQAVVLSGGTITNRFTNYLRNRLEDRSSGVIPKQAIMRGNKTLTKLFSLTLKLMVIEAPPSLFKCQTCEYEEKKPFSAVCVDGIWAGYDRSSSKPFVSISEKCEPIPAGRATSHRARPNTTLFRSDTVANILSAAIKGGKKDIVCEKSFTSALVALRVVDPELIPRSWSVQPIFSHVQNALEVEQILSAFRGTTFLLFKRDIIVYRLAKAMTPYLQKKMHRLLNKKDTSKRRKRRRNGPYKMSDGDILSEPAIVSKIIAYAQQQDGNRVPLHDLVGENGICWSDEVSAISSDSRRTLYNFYVLLLHGPLTQFVMAPETQSLRTVSTWFSLMGSTSHLRAQLLSMHDDRSMNIIKSNKFLMGSLFAVLELQETARHKQGKVLQAFGRILHATSDVVESFYEAYKCFDDTEASALTYKNRWETASPRLFRRYLMKNPEIKRQSRGVNDFYRSGVFFPNLPQVRPMPFNDKIDFRNRHRDYGSCSKHYDSLRPDFTPGAITFCCSCSHPIIFGFKVLERGEGPRAVLDVLLSRFPVLPRYIVYDFACGLLRSAQHTMWWGIKNTTFVSDRFHVDNHTCHRGFHPDSYSYLNGRNTVSYEQRNRPIAGLKESLRNCSQTLYISLLAYHTLYLNLKAKILQRKEKMKDARGTSISIISRNRRDITEETAPPESIPSQEEVQIWYYDVLGFKCPCCQS